MSSKRKADSDLGDVFVLTLVDIDHGLKYVPQTEIVGVYRSKEAAAAAAGKVNSKYGPMDAELTDGGMFEDNHEDNRDNPPDSGILIQLGSEHDMDLTTLKIEKFPIQGTPENAKKSKH